jgi:uncharacterized protein YqgC (DUF456 family)
MELILLILGIIALVAGLAGAILPIPGPPLSFVGMLALEYSGYAQFGTSVLVSIGVLTVVVAILDYYVPIWGAKRFGGSKWGMYGAGIGLLGGFLMGPLGWIIGPFMGAFIGEYLHDKNPNRSARAAFGSFMGLMAGIVVKVILCVVMLIWSIIEIVHHI